MSQQSDVGAVPVQFVKDNSYTTFSAEYGADGNDVVYHFFRTPEYKGNDKYWKETFPNTLSVVATDVFKATYPRLKAAFTEEVDSWWMRATGFMNVGDPDERSKKFFEVLDKALEAATPPAR